MNNLILKYAILGAGFVPLGVFLAGLLGMNMVMGYVSATIGGWLRQRKGKNS